MAKIYLVTSGCYSDYGINAAFSNREKAQAYIDAAKKAKASEGEDEYIGDCYWSSDANIEEWEIDGQASARVKKSWTVGMMAADGSIREKVSQRKTFTAEAKGSIQVCDPPCYNGQAIIRAESFRSADHAIKMAAEKRQEILRARAEKA